MSGSAVSTATALSCTCATTTATQTQQGADNVDSQKGCVLIVTANAETSKTLAHAVEQQGYSAAATENVDQAWTMVSTQAYDVLLLDCTPQFDGLQILDRLQTDPALHSLPVILLTD